MSKGDYTSAEAWAAKARELQQFSDGVESICNRWREVSSGRATGTKKAVTPQWQFYQPILKALKDCGGEATLLQLEPAVERNMGPVLQAGDRVLMARGRARWKVMIRRTRKHLVHEGWIESRSGPTWRITDSGKIFADKTPAPTQK